MADSLTWAEVSAQYDIVTLYAAIDYHLGP